MCFRNDCKEYVHNVPNAWYKKFNTEIEAYKCMKSRQSLGVNEDELRYKYQKDIDRNKQKQLSPGDVEFLKIQMGIIREKIEKCTNLFSKQIRLLRKRLDMVAYDINSISQDTM